MDHDPILKQNWTGTHDFLMDEFSSNTVLLISRKIANKGKWAEFRGAYFEKFSEFSLLMIV